MCAQIPQAIRVELLTEAHSILQKTQKSEGFTPAMPLTGMQPLHLTLLWSFLSVVYQTALGLSHPLTSKATVKLNELQTQLEE